MEPKQASQVDPRRVRAVFNLVTLQMLGYSYDQIEILHPANMTSDRLRELIHKKAAQELRRKGIKIQTLLKKTPPHQ
jgi:hypothetical protein